VWIYLVAPVLARWLAIRGLLRGPRTDCCGAKLLPAMNQPLVLILCAPETLP